MAHKAAIIFGFTLLTLSSVAQEASSLFTEMEPFPFSAIEKLTDPEDVMSPLYEVKSDDVDPGGVGYQFFIASGYDPAILHEDVCPTGYETTWYSFTATGSEPISFGFAAEVNPASGDYKAWFSPVFQDQYRVRAGNPVYDPPVHLAFCSFSATRGALRRSHEATAINEAGANLQKPREMTCKITVNNSGNQQVVDEQMGVGGAFCFGRRE